MGGIPMSSGMKLDRADTAYAEKAHELTLKNRNWLRHGIGTTADKIDEMLLDGATIEQMAKKAKTTKATVSVHLTHLRKEHKLAIMKKDGVLRYDAKPTKKTKKVARKPRKTG
jgi:DNA-binding transcriptional ArsR family regulator